MSHTGYRTYKCHARHEEYHNLDIVLNEKGDKAQSFNSNRQRLTNRQLRRHELKLHKHRRVAVRPKRKT